MEAIRVTEGMYWEFGSYGRAGGTVRSARELMQGSGSGMPLEPYQVRFIPHEEERSKCLEFGQRIAFKVKEKVE